MLESKHLQRETGIGTTATSLNEAQLLFAGNFSNGLNKTELIDPPTRANFFALVS
jgi:hypothetical protein